MKHSLGLALLLASGMTLGAAAQTPATPAAAQPGSVKIAVIAFETAVAKTNEGQHIFADLQKKYAPREAALKSLSDEIESQTKQLQAQSASLTEAERTSRAKVIDEKKKQLQRGAEDLNNDGKQELQEKLSILGPKVYEVLAAYAKEQGFKLVLDTSQQERSVLFASDDVNITQQVVDAYNLKSGVPAPPEQ